MISAWPIEASRVFSLPTVHDLTFAGALAISGLALVGLIAHELSLEHAVQPARAARRAREPARRRRLARRRIAQQRDAESRRRVAADARVARVSAAGPDSTTSR
jgi:hypothetical protein